jgi:hypothetical protein
MHPNLPDILSKQEVPIDNKLLADYLSGKLNDAEQNALEKKLMEGSAMENDAMEGWQEAGPNVNMLQHAEEINRKLQKQLHPTPARKSKKIITNLPVVWWVFGLLLALIVIAWVIISIMSRF